MLRRIELEYSAFQDAVYLPSITELKKKILHADQKCIALTSMYPDEGNGELLQALAQELASDNRKVVIVDADLPRATRFLEGRNPSWREIEDPQERRAPLSRMNSPWEKHGNLASFLAEPTGLQEILCPTNLPGVYKIESGASKEDIPSLLQSHIFAILMTALKQAYDYVLLLAPDLQQEQAALATLRLVDGMILTMRECREDNEKFTVKSELDRIIPLLEQKEITMMGFVILDYGFQS